jgi:hypothetical protein
MAHRQSPRAYRLFDIYDVTKQTYRAMLQFRRFPAAVWPDCLTRTPEMAEMIVAEGWSGAVSLRLRCLR